MKATLQKVSFDLDTMMYTITLTSDELSGIEAIEPLTGQDVNLSIGKYYKKRSLQSNAYAWELIGKIAKAIKDTSTNVYRKYIRELGICEFICVRDEAKEPFKKAWLEGHTGRYIEEEPSKLEGCTNLKIYYSSSDFDSEQMARFIDSIKADCIQLNIKEI